MASAATFSLTPSSFGKAGGSAYNSVSTSADGIGLTITAFKIENNGSGEISSMTELTGPDVGVYLSGSQGNIGVIGSNARVLGDLVDSGNLDGDSNFSANDPDEGLLFSFDQLVSLDYINFDMFTKQKNDDFNLTVDGVLVLLDFNANDTSSLVTNVPGQFDEYNFNSIVGSNFLFWADGDSDSFRIDTLNVSTVPVPAAAWLFGSALLGMFGFSRRKKA